jgi:hypothetical protein
MQEFYCLSDPPVDLETLGINKSQFLCYQQPLSPGELRGKPLRIYQFPVS